ncbi:MAG: S41 family peptidase [Bdellovibrionales bacterium]
MKYFMTFVFGAVFSYLIFGVSLGYSEGRYDKLRIYTQVFNLVEEHYVEKLDIEKMVSASVRGLLGRLDPYSGYLTKKSFKKFKNETDGGFNGIGFELTLKKRNLVVVSVVEDSPAWNAGILPGDQIVKVNNVKLNVLDFVEASDLFTKKRNRKIKLSILRSGEDKLVETFVRRKKIKINPVRKVLNDKGLLTIRVTSFSTDTKKEMLKILKEEKFNKLLIDLRNNPGGLLSEAIDVVDLFVSKGVIVVTKSRNPNDEVNLAKKDNTLYPKVPLYVLVDGSSASASEIVASALKDLKRAKVLGKKTYGKGSVQSVIPLPRDQGGIKLTIARYFTASGKMIDKNGVEPDFKYPKEKEEIYPVKNLKKDKGLQWAFKKLGSI